MFAERHHADLFSAGDENSPAGACLAAVVKQAGRHTKAIKLGCEGNILNQTAMPTRSILRKQRDNLR
jgi:hypothetical protein